MSDAMISALPGAEAQGLIAIREMGLQGMVTLRADLAAAAPMIAQITGANVPEPRAMTKGKACELAWMSPDEVLILCDHAAAGALAADLSRALRGQHHLVVDVSDARAMFSLTGPSGALRDVLSKITPADLSATALPVGEMRRTRLQQVAGALWFASDAEARVICFRSVARYVFDLLAISAHPGGAIHYHRA